MTTIPTPFGSYETDDPVGWCSWVFIEIDKDNRTFVPVHREDDGYEVVFFEDFNGLYTLAGCPLGFGAKTRHGSGGKLNVLAIW